MIPGSRVAGMVATLALAASLLAGCASTDSEASDRATGVLGRPVKKTVEPTSAAPKCDGPPANASYRPSGPPPVPGAMPSDSFMATLGDRKLKIAVDETTKYWALSDPEDGGKLHGLEIELGYAIARAIFGNLPQDELERRVEFVTVTTEEKFTVVEDGRADMTIDVASMACERWLSVDFSSPYYEAFQQLVVPVGSTIKGQDDLYGKRVCVTKTATAPSSSGKLLDDLNTAATGEKIHTVAKYSRLPCLIKLQEGKVDAIVLPNSIVAGLVENDPTMEALPAVLHKSDGTPATSDYGIAVNKKSHPGLTLFLNSLIAQWHDDGTLQRLIDANLPEDLRRRLPDLQYRD